MDFLSGLRMVVCALTLLSWIARSVLHFRGICLTARVWALSGAGHGLSLKTTVLQCILGMSISLSVLVAGHESGRVPRSVIVGSIALHIPIGSKPDLAPKKHQNEGYAFT